MANTINLNPIKIDTVTDAVIVSGTFVCDFLRYVATGSSAGDVADVQDKNGNVKWATVAAGTQYVEETHFSTKPLIFNGLKVTSLDVGTIYLYVRDAVPVKDA